jgi:chromosome segregation ATPase
MSILSFPTIHEPVLPDAVKTSTSDAGLLEAQRCIDDLRRQIECKEKANEELRRRLSEEYERLEEEMFQRKMLEFDLNQHKEAIAENVAGLRQREETIEVQGWLLRTSWLGSQAAASSQRQAIHVLQGKIDELSTNDLLLAHHMHNRKKRKFSDYGEPSGSPAQQLHSSCTTQFGGQHVCDSQFHLPT